MAEKNEFAYVLGQEVYDDTPKEVWAAIAVSYMSLGGDWPELAGVNLADEWKKLHNAEIVRQPVPKSVRHQAELCRQRLIDQGEVGVLGPDYEES